MMLLRNGDTDVNSDDPAAITAAKDAILQMIDQNDARLTINGTYAKLRGRVHGLPGLVGRHRRREVVPAEGTAEDVLGYWYPPDKEGLVGNDTIVITNGPSPRLASS